MFLLNQGNNRPFHSLIFKLQAISVPHPGTTVHFLVAPFCFTVVIHELVTVRFVFRSRDLRAKASLLFSFQLLNHGGGPVRWRTSEDQTASFASWSAISLKVSPA